MKLQNITDVINIENKILIDNFLIKNLISEKQLTRILIKSFGVKPALGKIETTIAVIKCLFVLKFIEQIEMLSNIKSKREESIKRLMSDNGYETANEIYCHMGLNTFFYNYKIANLYETLPDGFLIEGEDKIPIEIKSRLPKIFEKLNSFYYNINEIWEISSNYDQIIDVEILNVNKRISSEDLFTELENIKTLKNKINLKDLSESENGETIYFKNTLLEYSISIKCKKSENLNYISYSEESNRSMYFTCTSNLMEKTTFNAFISDNVAELLSKILITDCLSNIKNLPVEPRIITIYSPSFANEKLYSFINNRIESFVNVNKGTAVFGIYANFDERGKLTFCIAGIKAGCDIKEKIKKYFFKPTYIE